jgi:dTMP kinase
MQKKGKFITIEGVDGAGKSTQIPVIAAALREKGVELVQSREPGGTPLAEKIRSLLLSDEMDAKTEMLLMFAARQNNLAKVIEPALAAGKWVLCDRFTDASYAYQCAGRRQDPKLVDALVAFVHPGLRPDKTILLDVPTEVACKRIQRGLDRFEKEQADFHERVRNEYLRLAAAEPDRYCVIDASKTAEEVSEQIRRSIALWD